MVKREKLGDDLVSIVVPVYNAARFLDDTIGSVLAQFYSNWELLLVDDCSTDNSIEIIKKYCKMHKNIKLFVNARNSGAAISRNRGIDESQGRYLAFQDADDLWLPDKLEKQVAFMQANSCAFSFTGYEFADGLGKPNGKKVRVPSTINYRQSLRNTIISTITVMFDMHMLTKEDLHMPDIRRGQDAATWWKVLKKVGYAYGLDEVLSYYRRVPGTLSANKFKAMKRTWHLYRKIENLSLLVSSYNFAGYAFNAVRKRV